MKQISRVKTRPWRRLLSLITILVLSSMMLTGCAESMEVVPENITADEQSVEIKTKEKEEAKEAGNLEVHFLDVGQGDATFISCDGHYMLIDGGNNDKGTAVQNYLQKQGVETLDYVIGTHPDADHIGGLDVVLYKFDCNTIIMPDVINDTRTYDDVVQVMKNKNYTTTYPVVGQTYTLGGATFTIIAPNRTYGSSLNDWSVGILLQNGDNRFLFTGDAEEDAEADIVENGIDISADVYKVAHHGSNTATTDAFFEAAAPTCAVISAGEENSYGHPHAEVLNKLRQAGVLVFRTDEQGTIVANSDGNDITWNCSPSESWQSGEATGGSFGAAESKSAVAQDLDEHSVENSYADDTGTDESVTVHITESGSKYHLAGCQYLSKSDIKVTLAEAKAKGLEPCSQCNPPL